MKPAWVLLAGLLAAPTGPQKTQSEAKLDGYVEWRKDGLLIVDGQRVRAGAATRLKGSAVAYGPAAIPLGYEVKVRGARQPDGAVLARELEAKPNGTAMFEGEMKAAFDEQERRYRQRGRVFEEDEHGRITHSYGRLIEEGPDVERARAIAIDLIPPYARPQDFRVYVVDNQEWNAMAAPNGAVFVFRGLLRDLDDDEVAIVVGHELAHVTHEHSRRHFKQSLIVQLGALGALAATEGVDSGGKRTALQVAALLGASAWSNGYGRDHEDQADRVGLRYVHEAGYDVRKGPALWGRFAKKYGSGNRVVSFFFSDHSQSRKRAANLEREIALNYGH